MSSIYGTNLKISIFGQSHSPAIGVNIDGLPAGLKIDFNELQTFLNRRMPGVAAHSTKRKEPDVPEFLSGLVDNGGSADGSNTGITCGSPLAAIIRNTDTRSQDYEQLKDVPRPSHADYTAFVKYGESHDVRGGGSFSGRLTAPLCIAGGICLQLLKQKSIDITAHIYQIANVKDTPFDPVSIGEKEKGILKTADFPVIDKNAGELMLAIIEEAKQAGDSVGGIIECAATGLPAGIGDPMFDGMENRLSAIIFGIPAVKGIEFGNGFSAAELRGSQNNDSFIMSEGKIKTSTNRHGGILGGITSGMPMLFRVAIKPTPSISIEQGSVSLSRKEEVRLAITGRHDPCIVPRAVPCVEAAAAIAIYDALLASAR
ncbi:MAG: chorismate synthase [Treponema sp.]|nr:chorismate synthase [Treponema sp.]